MAAAIGGVLHVSSGAYAQCTYSVSIVAARPCGQSSSPTTGRGINEAGRVAGGYTVCGIGTGEAFAWDGGGPLTALDRPPGIEGAGAWDISDAGLIAGTMNVQGVGERAFVHDGTRFIELGVPPGAALSAGRGINNRGDVVGKWGTGVHAFLYRDGVGIDLGPDLGYPAGEALDINDQGQVTGWMGVSLLIDGEAFVWSDGDVTALGHLTNSSFSRGKAINELGQVVGQAVIGVFPEIVSHPFLWDGGRMVDLGLLPGFESGSAADINDLGQVVGTTSGVDGNPNIEAGFIWQNGIMTDLNDLLPPDAGVHIDWATAINNRGQITGQGDTGIAGMQIVAVLLTPVGQPVGDLDGDCRVGINDFLTLLAQWGPCADPCPPSCAADLDGDCTVGIADFLKLLANWQ